MVCCVLGSLRDGFLFLFFFEEFSSPDAVAKSSFLMIVDGSTFVEVARVMAPCVVNFGLHNYWFEDETVRLKLLARI